MSETASHVTTSGWGQVMLLRTQDAVAALQLEGLPAMAQLVDVVAQLVHMLQALCHDHLFLHQVRLG